MTKTHTKDKLAAALRDAGLVQLVHRASIGYYDDFLSPLASPQLQLLADLADLATPQAAALAKRVMNGDFDATLEESQAWADSTEGEATFSRLLREGKGV
jgi:hypothetical protein